MLVSFYLMPRALPWWVDPGNWLKYMHALQGNTWPMWGINPLHYPPLYFSILAALSTILGDEILALKISSIITFALLPVSTYVLAKVLFSDDVVALSAAWLMSLTPVAVEMLGWGGYPNLLGLVLLPLAFAGVLLSIRSDDTKWSVAMLIVCTLLGLAHVLTALIFCFTLVLFFGFRLLSRDRHRQWIPVLAGIAAALPVAITQVLTMTGSGYSTSNVMALERLQVQLTSGIVMWMFRDPLFFALMWVSAVMGACLALSRGSKRMEILMMVSWFLSPVVLSQLSFLGVALDFQRIFYHVFQPFTMLAATPLLELSGRMNSVLAGIPDLKPSEILNRTFRSLSQGVLRALPLLLVFTSLLCLPMSSAVGSMALSNVNGWYDGVDLYGDKEKLDLVRFVTANTRATDIFVAEDSIARWIEGYAQRRVVMHHPPMYLFMNGEIQREYVARAILMSTRGIRTQSAWILDQFPYGDMSPVVQLYMKGDYESVLYLDENSSYVTFVDAEHGQPSRLYLKDFANRTGEILDESGRLSLVARYQQGSIRVTRTATVTSSEPGVQLVLTVEPLQPSCRLIELVINMSRSGDRAFFETWREPVDDSRKPSLRVVTDLGDFYVYSTSEVTFPFVFYPSSDGRILGEVTMKSTESSESQIGQIVYEVNSLLSQMNISYVVIPMQSRVTVLGDVEVRPISLPEYDHLTRNPRFRIAYLNSRVILLSVG